MHRWMEFKLSMIVRQGNGAQTRMTFIVWNEANKHMVSWAIWKRIGIEALNSETRKRGTWKLFSQMRLCWWMVLSKNVVQILVERSSNSLQQVWINLKKWEREIVREQERAIGKEKKKFGTVS